MSGGQSELEVTAKDVKETSNSCIYRAKERSHESNKTKPLTIGGPLHPVDRLVLALCPEVDRQHSGVQDRVVFSLAELHKVISSTGLTALNRCIVILHLQVCFEQVMTYHMRK